MIWRIEVKHKEGVFDAEAEGIEKAISELGLNCIKKAKVIQIYNVEGDLSASEVDIIAEELLADPITQEYAVFSRENPPKPVTKKNINAIEIAYNPGVMDPVEHSTIKGIKDLGFDKVEAVSTAKKYLLTGDIKPKDKNSIINKVLSNKLIQHVVEDVNLDSHIKVSGKEKEFELVVIDLINADDKELVKLSEKGQLFLNLKEMQTIQQHFKELGRNPTDCELETIAQTWSEHCYHKTFRGNIDYEYKEKGKKKKKLIKSLLKSTIVKATTEIDKKWCVSVFHDNAGVIKFDKEDNICFKAETHNHPSALEPFGGANTGIGGVIRDILGTGLGAKPICCTDVFCFAPPDTPFSKLPTGILHPKRVMKGVVSGVRDYGNKMGIPTINGAILFDKHFIGNPLVYCGNIGIMPKDKVFKKANKGDYIVVAGGKTGRDGIHGATFSSGELTSESETVSSGAVQIGDPIQEKKVLDAMLIARDEGLYSAVTDCGAGGLSSAAGEMGEKLGVEVHLDRVPLKYEGLNYEEIWISESQERMVYSVSPKNIDRLLEIFRGEKVEATVIGEFTGRKRLELFYHGKRVCDLSMEFLHYGTPKITKKAKWIETKTKKANISVKKDLTNKLKECLSHYNVCSKEWVIRQYDHEVQGASIIKPLVGLKNDGPSDASVIAPKLGSCKAIAVSNGINIRYGMIDPFWMSASCIDEALRQIVSVGGTIDKVAILDNFCWGNPDKPDRLGSLVRAAEGCYKASVGYQVPFISGKDSLYNEYAEDGKSIAIPGTILISAVGIVDDVEKTVTMDFKKSGNFIYVIGETFDELGGSIYFDTCGELGQNVPKVNFAKGNKIFNAVSSAIRKGLIRSSHDCSEGGIAVAVSEMAFSGGFGATVRSDLIKYKSKDKRTDKVLFSESNSRFVVEVEPAKQKQFEKIMQDVSSSRIGTVEETPEFIVYDINQQVCIATDIDELKAAWQKPLRW